MRLVNHRIVQADDLVVDFDRVGNQHGVLIDAQHALGQAGFSVAGGAVHEDRILRNDGRAELVEHAVRHDQVGEGGAQRLAVDMHLGRLDFGRGLDILERNRAGAGVLRDLKTLARKLLARGRQREAVIVADHALDLDQLLRPHVLEHEVDDLEREAQRPAEAGQARIAFDQHAAEDQIEHQRFGDPQLREILRDGRVEGGADGRESSHDVGNRSLPWGYRQKVGRSLSCTDRRERASLFIVRFLLTFALLCVVSVVCLGEDFAEALFKAGQRAEKAGDKFHAFLLYSRAAALQPANVDYAMRKAALQADAAMSEKTSLDLGPLSGEREELSPTPLTESEIQDARAARMPPRLKGTGGLKSFDFSGDPKTVIEKVMAAYGLMVVFEANYQDPPRFRFRINDVRFEDAMRTLETLSNSFLVPVNERLALMVRDTAQKRTEMAPTMAIAIPIPERISVTEAQEMMTAVAQTMEIRKFSLDPVKKVVYLRDQVSKIVAAKSMFADLSRLRAQVEIEVEFLEVTKSSALGYGLQLPNVVGAGKFQLVFAQRAGLGERLDPVRDVRRRRDIFRTRDRGLSGAGDVHQVGFRRHPQIADRNFGRAGGDAACGRAVSAGHGDVFGRKHEPGRFGPRFRVERSADDQL